MATQREDPHADTALAWEPKATLPGSDYCSESVFQLERERLFYGTWFCVGRTEEVSTPGTFATVDVAGESLILARAEDGILRAFLNVCRHRGSRLCDGEGRARAIKCPYHAWSYGLDGRLLGTPNVRRGEQLPRAELGLHEVALEVWEGFIWVSIGGTDDQLTDHLKRWADDDPFQWSRYGMADLVTGARCEYVVAANWKIIVENYNECLHCPTVHPELVQIVPIYKHGEVEEVPDRGNGNQLRDGFTSFTVSGRSSLPHLPGLTPTDIGTFYGTTLLPNLILNLHSDTVSTFLLLPEGPSSTRVVCHYLFALEVAAADDFDPSEVVDFRHTLALQDWEVCERAQVGARSRGYEHGGTLPYADRLLYDFHQRYRQMVGTDLR